MSKNTGNCFPVFFKDIENILGLVILALDFVVTLNLLSIYSDDPGYLRMDHMQSFFQVFI